MAVPRYSLRIDLGDGASFTRELGAGRTVVGRAAPAGLAIAAEGVSREHAALVVGDAGTLELEDLGSTNGTRLNGAAISARVALRDGDQIGLGRALVTVQAGAHQLIAAAPAAKAVGFDGTLPVGDDELERSFSGHEALRAIYRLTRVLEPGAPGPAVARRVVELARETLGADRVVLDLADEIAATGDDLRVPAAVTDVVGRQGRALLTRLGEPPVSVLAVPVRTRTTAPGLLYAEAAAGGRGFAPYQLDLVTIIAHQAAALIDNARLLGELRAARDRLSAENAELRTELRGRFRPDGILGDSGKLEDVLRTVARVARTDTTVLITGESGTGKELIARTIHGSSPRKDRPFVVINCAAIPDNLIEAELFGIEKGVATGVDRRVGRFEQAEDGTLFLDEIGELPLAVQAKLLRILEERRIERVGGRTSLPMRARIVAATNRHLAAEVAAGRFRDDLFYRLNVVPLRVPPLRERVEDIATLAEAFVARFARAQGRPITGLAPAALEVLRAHAWPGNVRELLNELERAVTVWEPAGAEHERTLILPAHLSESVRVAQAAPGRLAVDLEPGDIKEVVAALTERAERQLIRAALQKTGDNKARAAQVLGLTREGLRKKMLRYGMTDSADADG
ncbi:MAG TPA: sigma 54-interacting transcriptional regulator [Kofleriaceae bacterium]|nr:sigma 54-interacting transcriptional regulator [Kofleriaceae bacterium]